MSLNALAIACHGISTDKGWWDGPRAYGEILMLIVSECAELMEAFRKGRLTDPCDKDNGLTCEQEEMADILIRLFDFAGHRGIDLDRAERLKMEYNEKRPYRHGGLKA